MKLYILTVVKDINENVYDTGKSLFNIGDLAEVTWYVQSPDKKLSVSDLGYIPSRTKVNIEEDTGIYDAMNKALTHLLSDIEIVKKQDGWVLFLNAGDTLRRGINKYKELLNITLQATDIGVLYTNMHFQKGNKFILRTKPNETKLSMKYFWRKSLFHQGALFRMNLFFLGYRYLTNYKIQGDGDLFLRLYRDGVLFKYLNISMVNFQSNGESQKPENRLVLVSERKTIQNKYFSKRENILYSFLYFVKHLSKRIYG